MRYVKIKRKRLRTLFRKAMKTLKKELKPESKVKKLSDTFLLECLSERFGLGNSSLRTQRYRNKEELKEFENAQDAGETRMTSWGLACLAHYCEGKIPKQCHEYACNSSEIVNAISLSLKELADKKETLVWEDRGVEFELAMNDSRIPWLLSDLKWVVQRLNLRIEDLNVGKSLRAELKAHKLEYLQSQLEESEYDELMCLALSMKDLNDDFVVVPLPKEIVPDIYKEIDFPKKYFTPAMYVNYYKNLDSDRSQELGRQLEIKYKMWSRVKEANSLSFSKNPEELDLEEQLKIIEVLSSIGFESYYEIHEDVEKEFSVPYLHRDLISKMIDNIKHKILNLG